MCGIIGINGSNRNIVSEAAKCFRYRGPDDFGIFADARMTIGMNRLAIIDLDARANQPFFDVEQEVGIVFNGEVYNYLELKKELSKLKKYNFRTASDTEVLLYAYKEWGQKFVERLRGMYGLAIYDMRISKVILASDISAIKPVYYFHTDKVFAFASEIKGILSMLASKQTSMPEVEKEAVDLYFAYGYIPAPQTLYKNIKRLPPKTVVIYDSLTGSVEEYSYEIIGNNAHRDLRDVLEDSVRAHLLADVPVGILFSGGTDSSLIVSILKEIGSPLEAFSVDIEGRSGDRPYFEAIAKELSLNQHILKFDQRAFEDAYDGVLNKLDEPIASNSILPIFAISKLASKRVKVLLSGEGGDEFFYGYERSLVLNDLKDSPRKSLGLVEKLYLLLPAFPGKNRLFEKLFIWLKKPLSYYLLTMSPSRDLLVASAWKSAHRLLERTGDSPMGLDEHLYLPNDLLRKIDLATMYSSIEGRVPLVDREVIARAKSLSSPPKGGKELKPSLKEVLSCYLPQDLVYRRKSGFGLHLPVFFSGSKTVPRDLAKAIENLKARGLVPLKSTPRDLLIKNTNLAWAIIVLDRVIRNNEQIWQGKY